MAKTCVVCSSLKSKVVFREFGIDVLRCTDCGHVFSSYEVDQDYTGYWSLLTGEPEDQFWWDLAHREMYADFCDRFLAGKSGSLLDVGCGLGFFLRTVSQYPDWQVLGYEISKRAVDFARTELGLENVSCGKVQDSDFEPRSFDIITLWDVIEHLANPDPLLSYLQGILKDEGLLFMHTPNIGFQLPKTRIKKLLRGTKPGSHYLEAKDHMNIYSMKTIGRVLHRNGFKKVEFTHLRPIQSVAGSKSPLLKWGKNAWYYFSKGLFTLSFGNLNLDNLFVIARK